MKKLLTLLILSLVFSTSFSATMSKPESSSITEFAIPIGESGKKISLLDLSNMKIKEFEMVSGTELSLKQKIAFKIAQKKLRNAIKSNATLDEVQLQELVTGKAAETGDKSQVVALILCIVVGGLGIHRFYLGYTWQGIVQLLTLGGCGIWALIDLIRIITGDLQPKDGYYDKTL